MIAANMKLCLLWFLVMASVASANDEEPSEREKKARERGFEVGGSMMTWGAENFRYLHARFAPATDEDRQQSHRMAADVRCSVCEATVMSLASHAKSLSEDDLADLFEASDPPAKHRIAKAQGDKDLLKILQHEKGCQRHFKHELLAKGWTVKPCSSTTSEDEKREFCMARSDVPLNVLLTKEEMYTYEPEKDALYYACESTVGKYGAEIASSFAELAKDRENFSEDDFQKAARDACRGAGQCARKRKKKKKKAEKEL